MHFIVNDKVKFLYLKCILYRFLKKVGVKVSKLFLKDYRVKNGLLQREVADVLNVSQAHYHKLEAGKSLPNSEQILHLCELFRCTPNDLFGIHGTYIVAMDELDKD